MIMSLESKNRLRLLIPRSNSKTDKVLKTCKRCRQHKTKCDAHHTNPYPCSHCVKKNLNCTLEIINKPLGRVRTVDDVEKLASEVEELSHHLSKIIERKTRIIDSLVLRGKQLQIESQVRLAKKNCPEKRRKVVQASTPAVSEIETCISTPESLQLDDEPPQKQKQQSEPILPRKTLQSDYSKFTIASSGTTEPVSLSHKQAQFYFTNYERNFNSSLPIFPDDFFHSTNLVEFARENELTFWCIITTSHLNQYEQAEQYKKLADHTKSLVVEKCWLQTPRSVYIISSLLILTTWPLPNHKTQISDNLCVKYISLMKSLSLQFGLHKLDFINEFSHKTKLNLTQEVNVNKRIRERIYKFININSNYWLINLGLSNNNYNGFTQDYIINKSCNIDIFDTSIPSTDQYINSLLKISMIQSKLNENMNALIGDGFTDDGLTLLPQQITTSRLINFNSFEIVLDDLNRMLATHRDSTTTTTSSSTSTNQQDLEKLIEISIAYSKLQLFVYAMSRSGNISIAEYKIYVAKLLNCCFDIVKIVQSQSDYLKLPIFFKFPIELALLCLLRCFKSPMLTCPQDYQVVKSAFRKLYSMVFQRPNWQFANSKLHKIIEKFTSLSNQFIMRRQLLDAKAEAEAETEEEENSDAGFFLVTKMKNYLVSSLQYELIWLVYENECRPDIEKSLDISAEEWLTFGVRDVQLQRYILSNDSICL
ncbi:uncharacterized protein LODBEIA_P56740 [Lodderomyces beijingensis]|uniref:Zn(2)-C6 fungal-type domain-containing protein n=1 Tax=Lodderomyces beijingensis TaxID=1775926 RepID=A0ABP0ZVM8_9ASCO